MVKAPSPPQEPASCVVTGASLGLMLYCHSLDMLHNFVLAPHICSQSCKEYILPYLFILCIEFTGVTPVSRIIQVSGAQLYNTSPVLTTPSQVSIL